MYRCEYDAKWSNKKKRYFHDFGKRPAMCLQPDDLIFKAEMDRAD